MKRLLASLPDGTELPEIIGIVVNEKGLERALATAGVSTIGYPYSISAYFRRSNANMSRAESRQLVESLKKATKAANKALVDLHFYGIWQSVRRTLGTGNCPGHARMAEGHPCQHRFSRRYRRNRHSGTGTRTVFEGERSRCGHRTGRAPSFARRTMRKKKFLRRTQAGCRRFDSALTGLGGCPFAGDDLVGNIPTESVLAALVRVGTQPGLDGAKTCEGDRNDQRDSCQIRTRCG